MKLTKEIKEKALAHAKEEYPKEAVGLVHVIKGKNRYFKCQNLAETPDEHFILNPKDYLEAEKKGDIIALDHTQTKTKPAPSQADKDPTQAYRLPRFCLLYTNQTWGEYKPEGWELAYVGREFSHGIVDCYSLVRDFYKREFKLQLNDYNRRDQWWEKGENMYLDNFAKEGFNETTLEQIAYGDLFLMQLESPVPNHAGIYLGDGVVLHHVQGRLSSRDVYGGYYQKVTAKVLKHESR